MCDCDVLGIELVRLACVSLVPLLPLGASHSRVVAYQLTRGACLCKLCAYICSTLDLRCMLASHAVLGGAICLHRTILALARCPGTSALKERRLLGISAHKEPYFNYLAVVSYEGTEYSGFQVSDRFTAAESGGTTAACSALPAEFCHRAPHICRAGGTLR